MIKKVFLILFILCFFLTGCGKVDLNTSTNINKDGSAEVNIKLLYDEVTANTLGNDLIKKYIKVNDLEVKKYLKDNLNIEEVIFKVDNIKKINEESKLAEFLNYNFTIKYGLFKNIYNMNIKFNDDVLDYSNDEFSPYIKNIPYTNTLAVPGKIENTNAISNINENTVEWTYKLGQLGNDTIMSIQYSEISIIRTLVIIGVLIIIIVLGRYLIKRKKKVEII